MSAPYDPRFPAGDPMYPPPEPMPYGYPPPYGYPGYPAYPQPPRRPAVLTAAAVLGYITSGLLLLAGIMLFSGASAVASLDDVSNTGAFTAELALDGFLNLLAAGLLIAGATMLLSRVTTGRPLFTVGAALVVVESIYWMTRWGSEFQDTTPFVVYGLLFGALAVIGTVQAWSRAGSGWLSRR